jgi:hypothetical protein
MIWTVMTKPKTRKELESEGVYLTGHIVPEWFKPKCDGCSVPRGLRRLMKAKQGHSPCVLHDWKYFIIPLVYEPGNILREHERIQADYELKLNREKVAKNKFIGKLMGIFYYRGVRLGGKKALTKSRAEMLLKSPLFKKDLIELDIYVKMYYPDFDKAWYYRLTADMEKELLG